MKISCHPYITVLILTMGIVGCDDPKDVIVGWGDSMMKGSGSKTSILDIISDELNITTHNFGQGGLKSNQVAVLQGGIPLYLTTTDSLIPANGSIELMPTVHQPFNDFGTQEYDGFLEEMSGTLERIHEPGDGSKFKHYLFERGYSWTEKKVKDTVLFTFENALKYRKSRTLIWAGRNDDKRGNKSEETLENIETMVQSLEGTAKEKFLILSICNGISDIEANGTDPHRRILRLNNMLEERYQEHYLDVRSYMVNHAIYDMKIPPTPKDLADIEKDCIPQIFFSDHVHFNTLGNTALGKYIAKVIQEKGWLD